MLCSPMGPKGLNSTITKHIIDTWFICAQWNSNVKIKISRYFPCSCVNSCCFVSLPQACNCSTVGSLDSQCNINTGQCNCRPKFSGLRCSECNRGHWNYPHCSVCECFLPGTDAITCDSETGKCSCSDQTGQCTCKV